MSEILNRLKELEREQTSVLRTAEPIVSRSLQPKKKNMRLRVLFFSAVVCCFALVAYRFKELIIPRYPVAVPSAINLVNVENQKNEAAVASYKQGDFKKAVEDLEALTKAHPARAEFHVNLAMGYQQLSNFAKAQEHLKLAITLDPKDSYALNNLGLLALKTKQEKLAEKSFTEAHKLNPTSPEITLNLASFFEKTGRLNKSVDTYRLYLALPQANQATVELIKKRIPRLSSLSFQIDREQEEEGT